MFSLIEYIKYIQYKINRFSEISFSQIGNILSTAGNDLCLKIYLVIALLIIHISVAYIFIKCLFYSIYFIYYRLTLLFRQNPSLYHSPLFAQIDDFSYYNTYFSYETYTIRYLFCISIIIIGLAYLKFKSNINIFEYYKFIIIFIIVVFILIIGYILMNLSNIIRVNNILNNLNKMVYDNLNIEILPFMCDYTENKKNSADFSYGKCNNIRSDRDKLWDYININVIEMNSKYPDAIEIFYEIFNKNPEKAKKEVLLKCVDDNNVSYYDKILRAMVTYSLLNYFIENNLRYEGSEFFSIYNTINTNILEEYLKKRINPFLYLKTKNLVLINYNFPIQSESALLDSKMYNMLKNDYDEIKDEITNGIIEAHDLFYYSIIPAGYIYILIAIIGIALIYAKSINL